MKIQTLCSEIEAGSYKLTAQKHHFFLTIRIFLIFKLTAFKNQHAAAAAAAKSLQLCPTLCDPRDGSPPGSSVPGILQARILEWVVIVFSNA